MYHIKTGKQVNLLILRLIKLIKKLLNIKLYS